MLQGKKILVGISGGIAAYKINLLVRNLIKQGAEVRCIMTPASSAFITPLTLATLSKNPVMCDFWDDKTGEWVNHVALGLWADVFIIAPLTASTLAKMSHGQSDNLLVTTYLSARCPVVVAPAMDLDMYAHPSTKRNLAQLIADGVKVIPAGTGELASGLSGEGRMAEPEEILSYVADELQGQQLWKGKKIVITAGPTYESIDPVRFIGNHSTGKMGFALAKVLAAQGAEVILLAGPTNEIANHPNVRRINVFSAEDLLQEVQNYLPKVDGGIFAAAVADYRPKLISDKKIKKKEAEMTLTLVKNPDVLAWAGQNKNSNQWLCGFALETNNAIQHGKEKLTKKGLDFIVVNTLEDAGAGFGHETNAVTMLDANNNSIKFELAPKTTIAKHIVDYIREHNGKNNA